MATKKMGGDGGIKLVNKKFKTIEVGDYEHEI